MQFGLFSVSDITEDPTTGHNPPFFSSSPTTTLAYIAAQTEHSRRRPRW
ncbi:MAG TPA: hypothetical protein VGL26_11405 [Jatrophihabitans sp.]|jgi:hypothetical protein